MAHVCVLNHLHDRPRPQDNMMQPELAVEHIKQYPGHVQAARKVKVQLPGKHFPQLTPSEQKDTYWATAVESAERHKFSRHLKAWGDAHTGPGMRFICDSDAVDDPDNKGFWTTLGLWNRWRHETYKDDRAAEEEFLDELPRAQAPAAAANTSKEKEPPEIFKYFDKTSEGSHTIMEGCRAGKVIPCAWWACQSPGCPRGRAKPIKLQATDTGALYTHLDMCNPQLAKKLRARSKHSHVQEADDGEFYCEFSFDESLPHHCRYVIKCFNPSAVVNHV